MSVQEEVQEMIVEVETLRAQSNALQQQLMVVLNTLQELKSAEQALENLDTLESKSEVLVPLGGGAFINAHLGDTSKVVVNLGANVMAEKPRKDAVSMISGQVQQLEDANKKLEEAITMIDLRLNELATEMQMLVQTRK
jgi:prefoldin alpha subunit